MVFKVIRLYEITKQWLGLEERENEKKWKKKLKTDQFKFADQSKKEELISF